MVMRRQKGERRLVGPVFKMANASMADFIQTEHFENRPFHLGYIIRNCLALAYEEILGKVFFFFSRREGLLSIFELNTRESSSTRRNLPGKRSGCLSFYTGKKQNSI